MEHQAREVKHSAVSVPYTSVKVFIVHLFSSAL